MHQFDTISAAFLGIIVDPMASWVTSLRSEVAGSRSARAEDGGDASSIPSRRD